MQKDILFYSNLCDFSKEVVQSIVKYQIKDKFMLVCVDKKNLKLPPFVDRVPLIYTVSKKLFADENLMNYIQSMVESTSLQPYSLVGSNTNAYSENFSFLDNGDGFTEDCSRNYNYLGMEQKIYAVEDTDDDKKDDKSQQLEAFMANRANDIQKIFGNTNNGFNRI
jgi:hypothetical protein